MDSMEWLTPKTQIVYLPDHAIGFDGFNHPDAEFGFIVSPTQAGAFCRFWRKGELGTLRTVANSESTHYRNIFLHKSVPDRIVKATYKDIVLNPEKYGYINIFVEEGDDCPICPGTMGFEPVENCSCHVNPPCSACVDNPLVCLDCGWSLEDYQ